MSEPNGQEPTLPVSLQQGIDIDDINGRLAELADINAALTARCATMRGQMNRKDAEIRNLTAELVRYRSREKEQAGKTVLADRGKGKRERLDTRAGQAS